MQDKSETAEGVEFLVRDDQVLDLVAHLLWKGYHKVHVEQQDEGMVQVKAWDLKASPKEAAKT